ncbi:MAG: hypothetical protein ACYDER_10610 [Ktedonobacteraceae bacterium]
MVNQNHALEALTEQYTFLLQTLCDMATTYFSLGRVKDALTLLEVGSQLAEAPEVSQHTKGKMLLQCGMKQVKSIVYLGNDPDQALATLSQVRQLAETLSDELLSATTLDWIGQAYYYHALNAGENEADFHLPLVCFQEALERRKHLGDARGICESTFNIGRVYQNTAQGEQARPYFVEALSLAEQTGHEVQRAEVLLHLGNLAQAEGDLETAQRSIAQGLAMREKLGLRSDLPFTYLGMGDVYLAQHEVEQAAFFYRKATLLAQEMELPVASTFALLSLGYLSLSQGNQSQALTAFEEACAIAQAHALAFALSAAVAAREEAIEQRS